MEFEEQTEKVFEACLACYTVVIAGQEAHCRKLLMIGLAAVMDLADGVVSPSSVAVRDCSSREDEVDADVYVDDEQMQRNKQYLRLALKAEGVSALAKNLLLTLAPYNYVVCRNCQRKQDLHGTSCYNCGNRLLVDVEMNQRNQFIPVKGSALRPISAPGTRHDTGNRRETAKSPSQSARPTSGARTSTSASTSRLGVLRARDGHQEDEEGEEGEEGKEPNTNGDDGEGIAEERRREAWADGGEMDDEVKDSSNFSKTSGAANGGYKKGMGSLGSQTAPPGSLRGVRGSAEGDSKE